MKEEAVGTLGVFLLVLPVLILVLAVVAVWGNRVVMLLGGTGPDLSALETLLGM